MLKKWYSSFKIIDDDIGLNSLNASEEAEAIVDLLGPDAPIIVDGKLFLSHFSHKIMVRPFFHLNRLCSR